MTQKNQGQRSGGSNFRVETKERTDGHDRIYHLPKFLANVICDNVRPKYRYMYYI